MATIRFLLILTLSFAGLAMSQKLRPSVDWASYEYDQNNAYVQVYYSFLMSDLRFEEKDGQLKGLTFGRIRLFSDGKMVKEFAWKSETAAQSQSADDLQKSIIDQVSLVAPYGQYEGEFVLKDLNRPDNMDSLRFELSIPMPQRNQVRLSEIELAGAISQGIDVKSPFLKNGLLVEPNPSLVYSFEKPALFFYVEAYSLPAADLAEGYRLVYFIKKADGSDVAQVSPKSLLKKKVVDPSVEFGMLNVGKLETDNYFLNIEIQKLNGERVAAQSKKFYVIQRQVQPVVSMMPFEDSIFASMDSAQVDLEFQMIFYLLSKEEQQIHKQILDLNSKRQFVYNVWHNKYPQDSVNDNPVRAEYYRRYTFANENFRAFKIDGWKTDRGRVYMLYGPPDDIDRKPNERDVRPYEVWFYNKLQNGVKFIFGDLEGIRNYRLVHSDLFGEIQDLNYMNVLRDGF